MVGRKFLLVWCVLHLTSWKLKIIDSIRIWIFYFKTTWTSNTQHCPQTENFHVVFLFYEQLFNLWLFAVWLEGRQLPFWASFIVFKLYLTCNQQHLGRENIKEDIKKKMYLGGKDSYFEMEHIESLDSFLASCDFWSIWNTPGAEKALFLLLKD